MSSKFNLMHRFALLSVLAVSIFDVSFGMKRPGDPIEGRESKRLKIDDRQNTCRQCPLNQQLINLIKDTESEIVCSSISPDGRFLAVGYNDGLATVWDICNGKYIVMLDARKEGSVLSITWSCDTKYIAIHIDEFDDDDCPSIALWKKDENYKIEGLHQFDIEKNSLVDFVFTSDARSFFTATSQINKRSFNPDNNFSAEEIKQSKNFPANCIIQKICLSADGRYGVGCFSESNNCIVGLYQLSDMNCVGNFRIAGFPLDCVLSPQNGILLLTKESNNDTAAACYTIVKTAAGMVSRRLFQLNHDNHVLKRLCYSLDGTFIVGYAEFKVAGKNTRDCLNINVTVPSPTIFVWDCYGRLLRKITIAYKNVMKTITILDAKIVGNILHSVFSDGHDTWAIACNVINPFRCLINRQYGIQPSIRNIQFQSLKIYFDENKKLSIEIVNDQPTQILEPYVGTDKKINIAPK